MKCVFFQTAAFVRDWSDLRLGDEELRELENLIMEHEMSSPVIRGTGGARKIRFSPRSFNRGKSGGFRVIYSWFPEADHVYLLLVYGKGEKDDLSEDERKACRALIERVSAGYRSRQRK